MPPSPSSDQALEVFRQAAADGRPALRQSAMLLLYLRWRPKEPNPATSVMCDLAKRVTIRGQLVSRRDRQLLDFLSGLSILIYINHCDDPAVVEETSDLWRAVLKGRLRLHLLNRRALERLIAPLVAQVYSRRIRSLLAELQDPARIFGADPSDTERFRAVAKLLDPAGAMDDHLDDIGVLLQSDVAIFRVVAAAALAVHAHADPQPMLPQIADLFEHLDARGRQWALVAFTVLFEAPPEWLDYIEGFTQRFVEDGGGGRVLFMAADAGLATPFDIDLLPLGLAYGRRGEGMPYLQHLVGAAIDAHDDELACRCIKGLAPVGFYYPAAVFDVLRSVVPQIFSEALWPSVAQTLATMRALHPDAVDLFLHEAGARVDSRNAVAAATEAETVRKYVQWIGFYNNAVHEARFHEWMRDELLVGALDALSRAGHEREFVRLITPAPLRMLREADYRLSEWTRPRPRPRPAAPASKKPEPPGYATA